MRPGSILKYISFGTLILVTLVFTGFKTHDLVLGTKLEIESPQNGDTVSDAFVIIKGKARGSSLLTVNGAKILARQDGYFERELLLGIGYNTIEIKALDHFNRERKQIIEIVYKPKSEEVGKESVALINN